MDESFNERGGIRLPDLSVPVATYTGWNLRDESIGNPGLFIGITGGLAGWTLPLPAYNAGRARVNRRPAGRPSRNATPDREDYLETGDPRRDGPGGSEGYLLEEDVAEVLDLAGRKYDYWAGDDRQC